MLHYPGSHLQRLLKKELHWENDHKKLKLMHSLNIQAGNVYEGHSYYTCLHEKPTEYTL